MDSKIEIKIVPYLENGLTHSEKNWVIWLKASHEPEVRFEEFLKDSVPISNEIDTCPKIFQVADDESKVSFSKLLTADSV